MSVQRWRESEVMIADNEHGWWVKYDDYVAAMLALEEQIGYLKSHRDQERAKGATNERFRIRQAVEAYLLERWGPFGSDAPTDAWCRELQDDLVGIIDGEQ